MKKIVISLLLLGILHACTGKKKYFTGDIKIKNVDIGFFDTLSTVLITSNNADLGGKQRISDELFGPRRVYKKNVPKVNGHFYVDSIEKSQYWILLIEAFMMKDVLYVGSDRNTDFSDWKGDTIEIEVYMQPGMTIKQN